MRAEIDPAFAKRALYIFEEVAKTKPRTVLDMGCGRGFYSHALIFFPSVRRVEGVDVNEAYLRTARMHCTDKRIKLRKASVYRLPFPGNTFDTIIFSEVLEHLENENKALQELRRVLKKNGSLLITVPNGDYPALWDPVNFILSVFGTHVPKHIWWLAGIWADHERLYRKSELHDALKRNGFISRGAIRPVIGWSWPFAHFFLYGVGKNIVEHLPGGTAFSRFEFEKQRPLAEFLASFMALPSRILDNKVPLGSSVNLFVKAVKK